MRRKEREARHDNPRHEAETVSDLAGKLQLKDRSIRVMNRPPGVAPDLPVAEDAEAIIVFVNDTVELDAHGSAAIEAAGSDALAWIAVPGLREPHPELPGPVVPTRHPVDPGLLGPGPRNGTPDPGGRGPG